MQTLFDPMGVAKGLRLEAWYRAAKAGKLLPPVQACVNPVHGCNLACLCCEFAPEEGEAPRTPLMMPEGHLLKVVDMLVNWGVKAVTFGTVGEPTLHKELADAIIIASTGGMDVSVITNGVHIPTDVSDVMASLCSVVWVKIPAGEAGTYEAVTRRRHMSRVKGTAAEIKRGGGGKNTTVGWLFEITNMNFDDVEYACVQAQQLGFDAFYARLLPAGAAEKRRDAEEMTNGIEEEVLGPIREKCKKQETTGFRVTVEPRREHGGFHQCYAAPLAIHIGADGNVYFCHDQYGETENIIGSHYPDPSIVPNAVWGGAAQLNLLHTDTPYWCGADCSLRSYHQTARALVWEGFDPLHQWQIIR